MEESASHEARLQLQNAIPYKPRVCERILIDYYVIDSFL